MMKISVDNHVHSLHYFLRIIFLKKWYYGFKKYESLRDFFFDIYFPTQLWSKTVTANLYAHQLSVSVFSTHLSRTQMLFLCEYK